MTKGRVKWFDPKKGFGFIVNDDGPDIFVHYTGIQGDGFRCLRSGQTVDYEQVESSKGLQGWNVKILEEKAPVEVSNKRSNPKES